MKKMILASLIGFFSIYIVNTVTNLYENKGVIFYLLLGIISLAFILSFIILLRKQRRAGSKIFSLVLVFIFGIVIAFFIAAYKDNELDLVITLDIFFLLINLYLIYAVVAPIQAKKEEEKKPPTPEEIAEEQMRKLPYTLEKGDNNTIIIKAKAPSHLTEEEKIEFEMNHETVILHCFTKEQIDHFRKIDKEIREQRDLEDQKLRKGIIFGNENARNLFLFIVTTLDEQDSSLRAKELLQKALDDKKLFDNESLNEVFIKVIQALDRRIRQDARKWDDFFKERENRLDEYLGKELEKYEKLPIIVEKSE